MATCADVAYNPHGYDPARSIGQAILIQTDKPSQRNVLRELVELYPGMLLNPASNNKTGFNPVRTQMDRILALPQPKPAALAYLNYLERLAARFDEQFPNQYAAEKKTLGDDIAAVKQKVQARFPQ